MKNYEIMYILGIIIHCNNDMLPRISVLNSEIFVTESIDNTLSIIIIVIKNANVPYNALVSCASRKHKHHRW